MGFPVDGICLSIGKYVDLLTAVKFVPLLVSVLMAMYVRNVSAYREIIDDSMYGLKDIMVGAEEVVSWRLGVDGSMNVFYHTVVIDWDRERRWFGICVIREVAKKFLYPCKTRK